MKTSANPSLARPKRPPSLLICAKCVRKADDGRAIRKALKAGLADQTATRGRHPGRLVETRCMGVCPKRAVTVASAATLAQGEVLLIRDTAEVPAALETLLAKRGPQTAPG